VDSEAQGLNLEALVYKLEEINEVLRLVLSQNPLLDQVEEVIEEHDRILEELGREI